MIVEEVPEVGSLEADDGQAWGKLRAPVVDYRMTLQEAA
jgi:hypothetical protein